MTLANSSLPSECTQQMAAGGAARNISIAETKRWLNILESLQDYRHTLNMDMKT